MTLGLRVLQRRIIHHRSQLSRYLSTAPPKKTDKNSSAMEEAGNKHTEVTAQSTHQSVLAPAVVTDIRAESPTVRGVTLKVNHSDFTFKAGQWVDLFIPGLEVFTGFSMYSSPSQLAETATLDLGIKFSEYAPAFWLHNQCKVGSQVNIRSGGDFYYDPEIGDPPHDLLLVAGGVGINPVSSMLRHISDLHKVSSTNEEDYLPGKILLLYSARSYDELIFKSILDRVSAKLPKTEIRYFTTRDAPALSSDVTHGRITQEVLKAAVESLNASSLKAFICGPPPMTDSISEQLLTLGLLKDQIHYEKWW